MGESYDELRKHLFEVLSAAKESVSSPSKPASTSPPVGGPAPSVEQVPSRSSVCDEIISRLNRLEARFDDIESVLMDVASSMSASRSTEKYVLDVLDRVDNIQAMVSEVYESASELSKVRKELGALKASVESLMSVLKDVSARLNKVTKEGGAPSRPSSGRGGVVDYNSLL